MTRPEPTGSPAPAVIRQLLQEPGPAQSAVVVHFCDRPRGTVPGKSVDPAILAMSPRDRLTNILQERQIRGHVPWGLTDERSVSFSEANLPHLSWLVRNRGFPSWGLIFAKQDIYDLGGGPVWYARAGDYERARGTAVARWAVKYEVGGGSRSEWTHEQEWRLHTPSLQLPGTGVGPILLVEDSTWTPVMEYPPVPTGNFLTGNGELTLNPTPFPEYIP